ncbi:MAG: MAPEG family protein [Minwuia sp.]|nr:MAPEG family protein [Minwuia sp.]
MLVIVAHLANVSNDATAVAAVAYFWVRLAHYVVYIAGVPVARTLIFVAGWLAQLCILYQILSAQGGPS